jgi:hypothetical protein
MRRFLMRSIKFGLLLSPLVTTVACSNIRNNHNAVIAEDGTVCLPPAEEPVLPRFALSEPLMARGNTMMALGCDLDHMEKHIDWYGSVTAKVPDVWGQQRLTKYRDEIEQQLSDERGNFKPYLQGNLSRTDQAFAVNATALSLLAVPDKSGGAAAVASAAKPIQYQTPPLVTTSQVVTEKFYAPDGKEIINKVTNQGPASPVPSSPPPPPPPPPPTAKDAGDATKLVADEPKLQRNQPTVTAMTSFGLDGKTQNSLIGLEPTEIIQQKKRYLELLAQLRRNNEGDDTADSPGYSLNLMRVPVSILPGTRTDTGHGAEVSFTVSPVLGNELLPQTFRNLIINDLTRLASFPLAAFLNDGESRTIDDTTRLASRFVNEFEIIEKRFSEFVRAVDSLPNEKPKIKEEYAKYRKGVGELVPDELVKLTTLSETEVDEALCNCENPNKEINKVQFKTVLINRTALLNKSQSRLSSIQSRLGTMSVPFSTGTRGRQSIPYSQFVEIYGASFLIEVAFQAQNALGNKVAQQGYAHLPDVQSFLKSETDSAYRLLKNPACQHLWAKYCTPDLVRMVHTRSYNEIKVIRDQFRNELMILTQTPPKSGSDYKVDERPEQTSTAALAWGLIVEAALLNDRLIMDIKETVSSRGATLPQCGDWPDFYSPEASEEAKHLFNEYVKKRWPIHVFALDPEKDEQNIADSLSTRREFQFALSVAFAGGKMNWNQFNRYARRLEAEYQTIDLNRTQVGFANGNDVFGWRFYPRYQTPPNRSNAVVILRDQLIGGPNRSQLLRERRLEPGPRECVALVIMPSFVPGVNLEVTSNWFGLANPKHKVFDNTQALRLSRTVQAIRIGGCNISDADKYREGDLKRLLNRAEQLSARLPMQTMTTQVPVESTLGGFELFVNGTQALAPELFGWYGAPGIDIDNPTTLFLVGDHYSVTQSKVLVGNKSPDSTNMISRQVMQVTVPAGVLKVSTKDGDFVQVNVATPYGVSQDLLVPVLKKPVVKTEPAVAVALPNVGKVTYSKVASVNKPAGTYQIKYAKGPSQPIWIDAEIDLGVAKEAVLHFTYNDCPLDVITVKVSQQGQYYMISSDEAAKVAEKLISAIAKQSDFTDTTNPFSKPINTTKIVFKQKDKPSVKLAKSVGFNFECSIPLVESTKPMKEAK